MVTTPWKLVALVVLTVGTLGCAGLGRPLASVIVLIPEGFRGQLWVAYGVASGQPPVREGASRVFRFPPPGILVTQELPHVGQGPVWNAYFESPNGSRVRIQRTWPGPPQDTPENRASQAIEMFRFGRFGASGCSYDHYLIGTRQQALAAPGADMRASFSQLRRELPPCSNQTSNETAPRPDISQSRRTPSARSAIPGDQHLTVVFLTRNSFGRPSLPAALPSVEASEGSNRIWRTTGWRTR
jgi:hypothetical protein